MLHVDHIRILLLILQMTPEAFAALGFPGADALAQMYKFCMSGKSVRDVTLTRKLNPDALDLDQWLAANKATLEKRLDGM